MNSFVVPDKIALSSTTLLRLMVAYVEYMTVYKVIKNDYKYCAGDDVYSYDQIGTLLLYRVILP